ncbi:MAG: anthranilate phosphoribosyltransferase [Rhodospirillales bacterium]
MSDSGVLKPYLVRLAAGETLSAADSADAFRLIMAGQTTDAQIGALLMALCLRGETIDEIAGAVQAMREAATRIDAPANAIDIVGTGGDASGTLNISTAAALIVAGCGVPVAKHGNRAQTSKCGSADVLAALGIDIDADPPIVAQAIARAGFGFLMAPRYHPAMRHVGPARGQLGFRTLFNLLGPLANPAGVKRQFTGTFARQWVEPMATVLSSLGCERAWVVHGADGLDELTLTGPSYVAAILSDGIRAFSICPEDAGLARAPLEELRGGDAAYNANAIRSMLAGEPGTFRNAALYNAAGALIVAGKADDLRAGVKIAARALDDGLALAALDRAVAITGTGGAA